jgi:glycine cleavage system H protein
MDGALQNTLLFKRSRFVAHLPLSYRYTRSHFWVEQREGIRLRVGFTSFGTRMLGEMVDHKFETEAGAMVLPGQVLGWIEGFKAVVDVLCAGRGTFVGGNRALDENIVLVNQSPFADGWLYEIDGRLEGDVLDVHAYAEHLTLTIDRLQKEKER